MSLAELFFRPFLSREGGLSLSPSAPLLVARHGKMLAQVGSMCGVSYNLSNWCWFSLITPKRRRYSMWKEGIGPSCTWQMVELFIANSYPVKLGFFFGWELFGNRLRFLCLHDIFMCWCKHAWTQGHSCTLFFSYWFSIIFPPRPNDWIICKSKAINTW